jgi:hypothetical protein
LSFIAKGKTHLNHKKDLKLNTNNYKKVYVTLILSAQSNQLLTESAKRSNRKKVQEAKIRLEDHLNRYRSISEIDIAVPH